MARIETVSRTRFGEGELRRGDDGDGAKSETITGGTRMGAAALPRWGARCPPSSFLACVVRISAQFEAPFLANFCHVPGAYSL